MNRCVLCGRAPVDPWFAKDGYTLGRCAGCGLVAVLDPPVDARLEQLYSFAEGYGVASRDDPHEAERLRLLARRHFDQVAPVASPPGRLLDVGCGAGFFLEVARRRGWSTEGVELNPGTAELAAAHADRVFRGRLEEAGFDDARFDAVTLWDVIEHVRDPVVTLEEAARVLRPGGVLALSTPNLGGLFPRLSAPIGRRTGYWTHPEPPAHLFQFSKATVAALLGRTGFSVLAVRHYRIPAKYALAPGGLRLLLRSPRRTLYALAFAVPHYVGPLVGAGDEITVLARLERSPRLS
jgi:SAM-dependent methyltransferase